MNLASGGADTPQRNRNNVPDLLRAMLMKVSVKAGKISNIKPQYLFCRLSDLYEPGDSVSSHFDLPGVSSSHELLDGVCTPER